MDLQWLCTTKKFLNPLYVIHHIRFKIKDTDAKAHFLTSDCLKFDFVWKNRSDFYLFFVRTIFVW